MPKLLVSLPDGEVSHDLTEELITIGRISENVLQIEDISVSSRHAQLAVAEGGDYVLTDIGSTNGTMLNGKDIAAHEDHKLQDGDKVVFGKIAAHYVSENPAEARAMPEAETVTAAIGSSSKRPADFANASPFQKKQKKKDNIGLVLILAGILAILGFGGVMAFIFQMQPPAF